MKPLVTGHLKQPGVRKSGVGDLSHITYRHYVHLNEAGMTCFNAIYIPLVFVESLSCESFVRGVTTEPCDFVRIVHKRKVVLGNRLLRFSVTMLLHPEDDISFLEPC
jgi:hypothetical protein